jgi:hypothetical protein
MTIRKVLVDSASQWLYMKYPDELPDEEIKPALDMCAAMLYSIKDVHRASDYLSTVDLNGRAGKKLVADVRYTWTRMRRDDIGDSK